MTPRTPVRPDHPAHYHEFSSPLTIPGGGVAGAEIVRELPADLALSVWQVLRTVLLWAAENPATRGGLFEATVLLAWERELLTDTFDAELRFPLAAVVGELADPPTASPEQVSWGCLCVAEWALEHRAVSTALVFAEAAGLASPHHARYAWTAGRLLRSHGRTQEAEAWLRRALRLAAGADDWETQARSLIALGNLAIEVGSYPRARALHSRALRVAERHGLREEEGMALHDLFVIATETGDLAHADEYARRAFEAYGTNHPRLPAFAHDVAYFWLERGNFASALSVLSSLQDHFPDPVKRLQLAANTSRAAAACGVRSLFDRCREEAWVLAGTLEPSPSVASCLVEVAIASIALADWDSARRALEQATRVAREAGASDVLFRAENLMNSVRTRCPAEESDSLAGRRPASLTADRLATDMACALESTAV